MSQIYFARLLKRALKGIDIEGLDVADKKHEKSITYYDIRENKVFKLTIKEVNKEG